MKSKATHSKAAQAAYTASTTASRPVPGARVCKVTKASVGQVQDTKTDRMERGRSPTVRALVWQNSMAKMQCMTPLVHAKVGASVQHVECATLDPNPRANSTKPL